MRESIFAGFEAASHYSDTFEIYRDFYSENERLDLEAVRTEEHGENLFLLLINLFELFYPVLL